VSTSDGDLNSSRAPTNAGRARAARWASSLALFALFACLVLVAHVARAADARPAPLRVGDPVPVSLSVPPAAAAPITSPTVDPGPDLTPFVGRKITRVDVIIDDDAWTVVEPPAVTQVRAGQPLSAALVRRAMADVLQSGRVAKARVNVVADGPGVRVVVHVVQRRLIEALRVEMHGTPVERDDMLRDADLAEGGEVIGADLDTYGRRIEHYLARRGFPSPKVHVTSRDTDDPTRVLMLIDVVSGTARKIERRAFYVEGADARELSTTLEGYRVAVGDRADENALEAADVALEGRMRGQGYHRVDVSHDLVLHAGLVTLRVRVDAGPLFLPRFEGNEHYDATALSGALGLGDEADLAPGHLVQKLRIFYVERGYLDADVTLEMRGTEKDKIHYLVFHVDEHPRVAVASRSYPCLKEDEIKRLHEGGPRNVAAIGSEIDSYLEEELPGADLLRDPDPRGVDAIVGGAGDLPRGARPVPTNLDPNGTYAAETYERAILHVQELYRNEGYLFAQVGPIHVLRRTCDKRSPPGRCVPVAQKPVPAQACRYDATNLPLPVAPLDPSYTCAPDPVHGVECEAKVALRIPILLGPRTTLYDMAFEGPRAITETKLAKAAALTLGEPVNTLKIEDARRRILELYKEEGYYYAEIKYSLDSSVDHTRARVKFEVTEGEQVIVRQIVIRGNDLTNDWTVRRRIALEVGKPYRTSDVRKTQERIATLNVFANVTVALEEPYVPQRNKVVIITVAERLPQYLELRPGFSTGEGFRGAFEYGHRNIGGDAIGIALRAQVSYLPDEFILDAEVRKNYDTLSTGFSGQRLATRITLSLTLPEIGLGPLVRMGLDGVYVRDLERDFVLTKFAAIPSLNYRPFRELGFTLSQSFERNSVNIFNGKNIGEYLEGLKRLNADLARLLRLPDGDSYAFAQRLAVTVDRRDNSFSAHQGAYFASGIEHVDWFAAGGCTDDPNKLCEGHTLKFTETVAAYVPITKTMTLAGELRLGNNFQLTSNPQASTYPDRFFFLGGIDSMRGYLQDSFVQQENADKIAEDAKKPDPDPTTYPTAESRCAQKFTISCVPVRGGNLMINPKLELRIPVRSPIETVIFTDAGNLWVDTGYFLDHGFHLRVSAGSGIRIQTPIGPLAFDYGVNMSRLLSPKNDPRRTYEDFGAFHFAIGLF
jgi:outer membrane protein assembly factor BamA